jgi:hypothetical protein
LREVAQNVGEHCYDAALRAKMFRGSTKVFLQVEASGFTCRIRFENSNVEVGALEPCIRGPLEHAHFPAPAGGCVNVGVPLSFRPIPQAPIPVPWPPPVP